MRIFQKARRIFLLVCACLIAVLLVAGNSQGQRDRLARQENSLVLQKAISDAAKKYKIPGVAAALIEHGQLRAMGYFGMRDTKSSAPMTANTVFEAGPLGEPVYAYAILLLSASGRFNPGSPLTNFLPLPYVRKLDATSSSSATEPLYDPQFNQITAIRVMNHTSGMPDWASNHHLRLQTPPGQKWSYSNEGYLYLQQVIEHVTAEPFDSFVMRSILGPARMAHSSFVWQDAYAGELATGYDRSGAPTEVHHYASPAATATLYTTIQDYSQFVTYLLASAPSQHAHESAVSLMLNPTVLVEGANSFSWGLGLGLEKIGSDLFFFQRENSPGIQCFVIASRATGNGIVIFTNSGNGLDAVPDIIAATIGGNHPILKSNFLHPQ